MIRKPLAVAAAVAGALVISACGESSVGVAARIGDRTIETSSFAGRVERAYEDETFAQQPKDAYQRDLLARLITVRIIEVAARRRGLSVSAAEVDERFRTLVAQTGDEETLLRQAASQGVPRGDVKEAIRDRLLQDKLMDDLVKDVAVTEAQLRAQYQRQLAQFDTAQVAHILVRDAKQARTVAAEARAPGADFGKLAEKYSQDTETSGAGGDLGTIGNGEGRFAKEFEAAVFQAQTGDIVGPVRTVTQGDARVVGYEIIKVVKRTTRTFAQARDDVRRAVLAEQREQRYNALVTELSRELGVKVNPRFGRWDAQRLAIVPADGNVLSSPAPVPGADLPVGVQPGTVPGTPQAP